MIEQHLEESNYPSTSRARGEMERESDRVRDLEVIERELERFRPEHLEQHTESQF